MRQRVSSLGFREGGDYARLTQYIDAVHTYRLKNKKPGDNRGAGTKGVNRTSALVAISLVDESVNVILRRAGLDWESFRRFAAMDGFDAPRISPGDTREFNIVASLQRSLEIYARDFPQKSVLDAAGLAYGIIASALEKPGHLADRLRKAGLTDPGPAREKLKALVESTPARSGDIALSPSVERIVSKLSDEPAVSAWDIVLAMCAYHTGYGSGKAAELLQLEAGPGNPVTMPVEEWMKDVQETLDAKRVDKIHGRLLILALARLDPDLGRFLRTAEFLQAVEAEVTPASDELFVDDTVSFNPTELFSDAVSVQDHFARKPLAGNLARLIDRLWYAQQRRPTVDSTMIHIDGRWGSGKSTFLGFLADALHAIRQGFPWQHNWIVVRFNAWENQHFQTPWWPLYDSIYRGVRKQLLCRDNQSIEFPFSEYWFRLKPRALLLWALLPVSGFFFYSFITGSFPGFAKIETDWIKQVGTILTGAATAVTFLWNVLVPGKIESADSMAQYIDSSDSPLEKISRRYERMLESVNRPVCVMIDDLDRCDKEYVVGLLEGIQTLFRKKPVVYVIAGDRRWIDQCFEKHYAEFDGLGLEDERKLGQHFLEKLVQLSFTIPALSQPEVVRYVSTLTRSGSTDATKLDEELEEQRETVGSITTFNAVFEPSENEGDTDETTPEIPLARRMALVERIAELEPEEVQQHFLAQIPELLDRNPRFIKRLVNAYSFYVSAGLLLGVVNDEESSRKLALWTVMVTRWPDIARVLSTHADLVDDPEAWAAPFRRLPDEVRARMRAPAITQFLRDGGLQGEDLARFAVLLGVEADEANEL